MLPMGTIMTVSMLVAVLFAAYLPVLNRLAPMLRKLISAWVFLAGTWNVFWYGVQHLTEFWGIAALVSGALMLVTAAYIYNADILPVFVQKTRPLVLLLLVACACLYGVTIYNL
ncbi:MAG: hypothetical protein V7785_07085 [Bermanella sp.]